jgi:DNA-directed RNA polymerase specialized sigma24 family protein
MVDFVDIVEAESRSIVAAVIAIVGDRHRARRSPGCLRRHQVEPRVEDGPARRLGAAVAINEAISVARRRSRRAPGGGQLGSLASWSAGVDVDPLAALDDEGVWAAVRALPTDQAAAIALRYGADLGVDEVADTLGCTVPAARSLLHRGRTALRASPVIQSYAP